jgi:hypothetical protein
VLPKKFQCQDTLDDVGNTLTFMEHWINEVMDTAEKSKIPCILKQPEHKRPLHRYGMDYRKL